MTKTQANEMLKCIKNAKKILLTTHVNPDGDGIGSGLALMQKLLKMGKKVDFINRDVIPQAYHFLPGSSKIKSSKRIRGHYDLIIFLECPDVERNGHIVNHIDQTNCSINLDHHLGNAMYADVNIVEPKQAAVGMQLFDFMKHVGWKITPEIASGLYTAIITDTGSFAYSNTTPEVHLVTAELIKAGAKPVVISSEVYATTANSTRLMTKMLAEMKLENRIGWSKVTKKMLKDTGAKDSETDNFINSIRAIRGIEVAMLFKEVGPKTVKVSFRSKQGVNVNVIATEFKGGGHKYASGCVVHKPMKDAMRLVLKEVRKYYSTRKK